MAEKVVCECDMSLTQWARPHPSVRCDGCPLQARRRLGFWAIVEQREEDYQRLRAAGHVEGRRAASAPFWITALALAVYRYCTSPRRALP